MPTKQHGARNGHFRQLGPRASDLTEAADDGDYAAVVPAAAFPEVASTYFWLFWLYEVVPALQTDPLLVTPKACCFVVKWSAQKSSKWEMHETSLQNVVCQPQVIGGLFACSFCFPTERFSTKTPAASIFILKGGLFFSYV